MQLKFEKMPELTGFSCNILPCLIVLIVVIVLAATIDIIICCCKNEDGIDMRDNENKTEQVDDIKTNTLDESDLEFSQTEDVISGAEEIHREKNRTKHTTNIEHIHAIEVLKKKQQRDEHPLFVEQQDRY